MRYFNLMNKICQFNHVSDCISMVDYDPDSNLFVTEGPYAGFGFICQPTNGRNEEIQSNLEQIYEMPWPEGTLMTWQLVPLQDVDAFMLGHERIRGHRMDGEDGRYSDDVSRNRRDYLRDSMREPIYKETGLRVRNFEQWITVKIKISEQYPSEKEELAITKLQDSMFAKLRSIGFHPQRMTDEHWKYRVSSILNRNDNAACRTGHRAVDSSRPLSQQIIDPGNGVFVRRGGMEFKSGDQTTGFCKFLSIKEFPEWLYHGQMLDLIVDWREGTDGINDPFILTLQLEFMDKEKSRGSFEKKRGYVTHNASGPMAKWSDRIRYQKQDYDLMYEEIENKGAHLVKAYLQLAIFGDDEESCNEASRHAESYYGKQRFRAYEDNYFCYPFFLATLPFGVDAKPLKLFRRQGLWSSKGLAHLTPHLASWKGNTAYPVLELVTRTGQLFGLDLFKTDGSYNCVIAAASGSGKSFLTNAIIQGYLGSGVAQDGGLNHDLSDDYQPNDGARVFVIDVGKSYEALCEQYAGGQFLDFGMEMKYSMNPFPAIDDFYGEENGELGQAHMVLNLLKTMASESGEIPDSTSQLMLTLLTEMWEELGSNGTITHYAAKCLDCVQHPELVQIGHQLKPWCEEGVDERIPKGYFGRFFGNKHPPVDFKGRLIICELNALKSVPHLQKCVLMAIINNAQHAMMTDGGCTRNSLFILDEAWEYLKDNAGGGKNYFADFLETGWRRFRKTRCAGICVTQSLFDAYQSQAGIAIVNNSPWKLLLHQEPETVEALQKEKAFDGSELDFQMIKSVHTNKGFYSEIYVRLGQAKEICRLFVDKRTVLMYSTDPDDRAAIAAYRQRGLSITDSIDAVLNDRKGRAA
ncbi:TraC family protein [Neiella sp. HB171785]|uniref:TraC family protein n=1 Tax=Neiella litorisoli TaxID=2771431 RepID=A0A8J6QUR9_9GAMM|nr:TraC family protein [Neiella litorisoli]MBD1389413.1 TraC family protein [Neiella litorisoli]